MSTMHRHDDKGSISLETLVTLPVLIVLTSLVAAIGWLVTGQAAINSAANESARAATLARDKVEAETFARDAAETTLDNSDLRCREKPRVEIDTSGFDLPVGSVATVTVTVSCEIPLAGFDVPGLGDRTVSATATSALDTFRGR